MLASPAIDSLYSSAREKCAVRWQETDKLPVHLTPTADEAKNETSNSDVRALMQLEQRSGSWKSTTKKLLRIAVRSLMTCHQSSAKVASERL